MFIKERRCESINKILYLIKSNVFITVRDMQRYSSQICWRLCIVACPCGAWYLDHRFWRFWRYKQKKKMWNSFEKRRFGTRRLQTLRSDCWWEAIVGEESHWRQRKISARPKEKHSTIFKANEPQRICYARGVRFFFFLASARSHSTWFIAWAAARPILHVVPQWISSKQRAAHKI